MLIKSLITIRADGQEQLFTNRLTTLGLAYFYNRIFNALPNHQLYLDLIKDSDYTDFNNWTGMKIFQPWNYVFLSDFVIVNDVFLDFSFSQYTDVKGAYLSPDKINAYTTLTFPNVIRAKDLSIKYSIYV